MTLPARSGTIESLARIAALTAIYFAAGRFGLALAVVHPSASTVWPPTGIALAAVLLSGAWIWPGIFLGAFLVNVTTAGHPVVSLGIAAGNTLEALAGAALVRRFGGGLDAFEQPSGVFAFASLAGLASTTLSATCGVTSLVLGGLAPRGNFGPIWLTWWLGDAVGAIIVAPTLVLWARTPRLGWDRRQAFEAVSLAVAALGIGIVVFGSPAPAPLNLKFLAIPPLLWAALRFSPREASTAAALLAGLAIWGTFGSSDAIDASDLLVLQAFMGVVAITTMATAAESAQRRRAEQGLLKLNESLEQRVSEGTAELRAALTHAGQAERLGHIGSWEWDIASNRVTWSDELYRLYGLEPGQSQVSYDGFLERVHPDDREMVKTAIAECFETHEAFAFDHRIQRFDGTRWLHGRGTVVLGSDGRPQRLAGTARDITERKRIEMLFRGVLESAPDALVIVNRDGRIVLVNAQTEALFGWPRRELLGQSLERLIPERYRPVHERYRSGYIAAPKQRPMGPGLDLYGLRRNGTEFSVEISLSPLETEEGHRVIAAIRDITERKLAESKLREYAEELARSNEELERFAYVASHDLQEPLRMVTGFTQLLARRYAGKLDADADEFIGFAVDGATRMQALIADLLAYSRVGSQGLEMAPTDSERVLSRVVGDLAAALADTGGEVSHGPLPTVMADETQLGQLFQNLIANALKFRGPEPPRVHVSAEGRGDKWLFSVRDNGIGIPAEHRERIFVVFQRLHTHRQYPGTGIGLAICKRIVERHGGTISVDSAPGQGSVFRFEIRAARSET